MRAGASSALVRCVRRARPAGAHASTIARLPGFASGAHRQSRGDAVSARLVRCCWTASMPFADQASSIRRTFTTCGPRSRVRWMPSRATGDLPTRDFWEMRSPPAHFVFSKVMAWAALDRGIAAAEALGLTADLDRWRAERTAVREQVLRQGYDQAFGCFVQSYGSRVMDAASLLMARSRFIEPSTRSGSGAESLPASRCASCNGFF